MALRFVVIFRIKVDGAKGLQQLQLFAPFDILDESDGDGFFLSPVTAHPAGFFD
jgi:hypothetical protein